MFELQIAWYIWGIVWCLEKIQQELESLERFYALVLAMAV